MRNQLWKKLLIAALVIILPVIAAFGSDLIAHRQLRNLPAAEHIDRTIPLSACTLAGASAADDASDETSDEWSEDEEWAEDEEWSEEEGRFTAMHHPFTMPMEEDLQYIDTDPGRVRAKAYDIVLNGCEIGGGSVRIHQNDIQEKMFSCLGFTKEQAREQFSFLLEAFKYGVPPHAGLAYGLDRVVMLMLGLDSIRDCIAFPKVKDSSCMMTQAPAPVTQQQLDELGIAGFTREEEPEAQE